MRSFKWSIAQVQLRKQNTAIKEGFQSVIDYWPDSPQAIAAAYYIGQTYKEIGRVKEAKKALRDVVSNHPQSLAAVLALGSLVDITTIENDIPARVELWKKLVSKSNARAIPTAPASRPRNNSPPTYSGKDYLTTA